MDAFGGRASDGADDAPQRDDERDDERDEQRDEQGDAARQPGAPGPFGGWPPSADQGCGDASGHIGAALGRFPLFALPNAWLFPGAVMPLFVFEPRYVQMVEDLLDRCGRLVIGTVVEGGESQMHGCPPVMPVGGLGEIGRHERRPDGRFVIVVVGLARVAIAETASERLYRQVEARAVRECCDGERPELRARLVRAIGALAPEAKGIGPDVPLGRLADFVLLRLSPGPRVLRGLHAELDEQRRAERVLELYDAR